MTSDKAKQLSLEVAADELKRIEDMANMVMEREWAEHAGKGPISSKVEAAFTQMHNELATMFRMNQILSDKLNAIKQPLLDAGFAETGANVVTWNDKPSIWYGWPSVVKFLTETTGYQGDSNTQLALNAANDRIADLQEQLKRYQHQFPGA